MADRTPLLHIELLRVIAIFLVIFNHTGTYGFVHCNLYAGEGPYYWLFLFISISIKIAVPIFFMISGALLLKKEESLKHLWKKRVLKMTIVLILFSFISYLYLIYTGSVQEFSISDFLVRLYTNKISTQYWFLYSYIAFLILLPILRIIAKNLSPKLMMYIIALYLTVQTATILQYLVSGGTLNYTDSFYLFITQNIFIYPILGYYLENRLPKEKLDRSLLMKMTLASIIAVSICSVMTWYHCGLIGEWKESTCQVFFQTLTIIPAATAYLWLKYLFTKHDVRPSISRIIITVGSASFGIYLLEQIYRKTTFGVYTFFDQYMDMFPATILWISVAFLLGLAVTMVLWHIPGLNKLITNGNRKRASNRDDGE